MIYFPVHPKTSQANGLRALLNPSAGKVITLDSPISLSRTFIPRRSQKVARLVRAREIILSNARVLFSFEFRRESLNNVVFDSSVSSSRLSNSERSNNIVGYYIYANSPICTYIHFTRVINCFIYHLLSFPSLSYTFNQTSVYREISYSRLIAKSRIKIDYSRNERTIFSQMESVRSRDKGNNFGSAPDTKLQRAICK